jgi:hypothetical protein
VPLALQFLPPVCRQAGFFLFLFAPFSSAVGSRFCFILWILKAVFLTSFLFFVVVVRFVFLFGFRVHFWVLVWVLF